MQQLYGYLKTYFRLLNPGVVAVTALFLTVAIYINYSNGLDRYISLMPGNAERTGAYALLLFLVFGGTYAIQIAFRQMALPRSGFFYLLLFTAILLFAAKMGIRFYANPDVPVLNFPDGRYWNLILHWPVKAILLFFILVILWKVDGHPHTGPGLRYNADIGHYLPFLLVMLPILYIAAGGQSFQNSYPKFQQVQFIEAVSSQSWLWYLLYELSYGIDFFSIEFFFRGFLVLAFARYAGIQAILPMAAFYCVIHFGKPVAECISSFFGGMILGAIVYHSKSIWGGLLVHLGIAWAMELLVWIRN